jgi:predicted DNA-binding transcriptional regulator YafY
VDHASKFGISDVQVKIDIKTYRNLSTTPPPERKPGPAAAGASPVGTYSRPDNFAPIFDGPRTLDDLWLTKLEDARPDESLSIERLASPPHFIEPDLVRSLLAATELRESCQLRYQSMTSAEASDRIVCPHALVKASGRFHIRAFDFSRKRFIDFSLSRVLSSAPSADQAAVPAILDDDWHAMTEVEFIPHPKLSPAQRSMVAREFGMKHGLAVVRVRRALLFYLLDEMRLLAAIKKQNKDLADVPVWVRNARHVAFELSAMESRS